MACAVLPIYMNVIKAPDPFALFPPRLLSLGSYSAWARLKKIKNTNKMKLTQHMLHQLHFLRGYKREYITGRNGLSDKLMLFKKLFNIGISYLFKSCFEDDLFFESKLHIGYFLSVTKLYC